MDPARWRRWIAESAEPLAQQGRRDLAALVDVSSPSGDREAAEAVIAVATALLPREARIERIPCSSPDHADDLLVRLGGSGGRRLLLLGHLDTVIAHAEHHPLRAEGGRLVGPGSIDMKGGVALAIGLMHALARVPSSFAEVALLLVVDEEWRCVPFVHGPRFASFDACLCFEAGELTPEGADAVVVERKAAGTIEVAASGVAAHSGSEPERGRSALLALAETARIAAAASDADGPDSLTVVPTILRSGEAINVVPGSGELVIDARATRLGAIDAVAESLPGEIEGVSLATTMGRRWPSMAMAEASRPLLEAASGLLGRELVGASRGGASDASHMAESIAVVIDGLGPIGAGSHAPDEHVSEASLGPRSEVALAFAAAVLADD